MNGLSLDVKVGLLLLVALLLMGGFLFVLGGSSWKRGYTVYVDFDNPGGLKPGAAVRIAGTRIGTIEATRYLGGKLDPATNRRSLVRVELSLDEDVRETIHDDALFYVGSQGVLGESFMAVDPGTEAKPALRAGSIQKGVDPPRLDLALAMGFELLDTMVNAMRDNRDELRGLLHDTSGLLKGLNNVVGKNEDKLHNIVANLERASLEGDKLLRSARENYVESPQVKRILSNVDKAASAAAEHAGPLLAEARGALDDARDVLGPEQRAQLKATIGDVATLAAAPPRAAQIAAL